MKQIANGSFVVLLGLSAVLLARLHDAEYKFILAAGTIPLTMYFGILFANVKKISRNAIDNIYYFGFLITIVSLAISAYNFDEKGMDLSLITKQFSVGLVATGLALMYKLVLQDWYVDPEEQDIMKKQTEQMIIFTEEAGKMFFQLQLASKSLTELANNSFKTVHETYVTSKDSLKELQVESMTVMSESVQKAIGENMIQLKNHGESAGESLRQFSELMNVVAKDTSFKKFGTTLSKLEVSLGDFSNSVDGTVSRIEDSTSRVTKHHGELENLTIHSNRAAESLLEFRRKIEEDNTISERTKELYDKKLNEQAQEVVKSFAELSKSINQLNDKLHSSSGFRDSRAS